MSRPHSALWLSIFSNPRPLYPHWFNNILSCIMYFTSHWNPNYTFPRNGINMDGEKKPELSSTSLEINSWPSLSAHRSITGLSPGLQQLQLWLRMKGRAISVQLSFVIREESIRHSFSTKSTILPSHNLLNYSETPLWFRQYQKELFWRRGREW